MPRPYLTARALIQFNAYLPAEGPDAWVVPLIVHPPESAIRSPERRGFLVVGLYEPSVFLRATTLPVRTRVMTWSSARGRGALRAG